MTTNELKLCLAIARSEQDLSGYDDSLLFGFGCPDFQPVTVPAQLVAHCIRWQCCKFNGGFDWQQFSEDAPFYRRKVRLAEFSGQSLREVQSMLAAVLAQKLGA